MAELDYPIPGLAALLSPAGHPITEATVLRRAIQGALSLEFALIAPSLTALWSIPEPQSVLMPALQACANQRMARVYQLANLLLSIGGVPKFTANFTPAYPCQLLPAVTDLASPTVSLRSADATFFTRFMPLLAAHSAADLPLPECPVQTLGQFYRVIEAGMVTLEEEAQLCGETIFGTTPGFRQQSLLALADQVHPLTTVTNLLQAHEVLRRLLGQIEGGVVPLATVLVECIEGRVDRPGTIALSDRPLSSWTIELQSRVALFDSCYSQLLRWLERSFEVGAVSAEVGDCPASLLLERVLPVLGRQLMQIPVAESGAEYGWPRWGYSLTPVAKALEALPHGDAGPALQPLLQRWQLLDAER